MAGIENIWFTWWVQLTNSRFVSVARSIPQRVAHPPPFSHLADVLRPTESAFDSVGGLCSDATSTFGLVAIAPQKGYLLMQKAHLYEALYLVNHGIDEAVRGVQRLKKAPHAFREVYYKSVAGLERRRALINGQFMHEMSGEEEDNASYFEEEFNRWLSDDPLDNEEIYKLVRFIEDQRKKMGEPPLVQFLKPKKQEKENVVLKQALTDTTPKPRSRLRKPGPRNTVAQSRAASDALNA
jgi:hypothetical protein